MHSHADEQKVRRQRSVWVKLNKKADIVSVFDGLESGICSFTRDQFLRAWSEVGNRGTKSIKDG